jgi:prevent-host-death family protein
MTRTISAAEANRSFSRLLREVRETGAEVVVTAHGRPVAVLAPAKADAAARTQARAALRRRLAAQPATDAGRWSRDELYAR